MNNIDKLRAANAKIAELVEEVKRQRTYIDALEHDVRHFKEAKDQLEAALKLHTGIANSRGELVKELEIQLKLANEKIANLRDADKRAVKIAAEVANAKLAEVEARLAAAEEDEPARIRELKTENRKLREANRRLQMTGAALDRDKLIIQLRADIAKLEGLIVEYSDGMEKAEADVARLRDVLTKVEAWMSAVEIGPICGLWDDGIIGNYEYEDGGCVDWSETLSRVRDLNIPIEQLGTDAREHQLEEVALYREILAALPAEQPIESEGEK